MYIFGQRAALAQLGLTKHAASYFEKFPETARKMMRNHAIAGAVGGGVLGAGAGVLSNYNGDAVDKTLGGVGMGLFGGMMGGGLAGVHGLSKGLGQKGLHIGPRAKAGLISGALTGGLYGLMDSRRDNMAPGVLGGAAYGGLMSGAVGAGLDTFAGIDPHLMRFFDMTQQARGRY